MTDLLLFFFFKSYAHPRDLPSPPTRPSPDLAPADFKTIGARVRAVGAHVAIYVDTLAPPPGLDSAEIDTLRQVFDTLLYPLDSANFGAACRTPRSEEHTSELQSRLHLVCRLLLEKKKKKRRNTHQDVQTHSYKL